MQPSDSAKINDSLTKEKTWAERNKAYLQSLAAQKKLAEDKQALQLEQEQRKKAKLRRQVLGASFDRFYPRASNQTRGEGDGSGSDGEASGGGLPGDERCGSPGSAVPKLPPLAEASESGMGSGAPAEAGAPNTAGTSGDRGAGRRPHPLTRSVSLNSGAMASGHSWSAGGGGHGSGSASVPGQQRAPGPGRQRRATLSNPSGMDTVQEHAGEAADAADDEGPDQGLGAGGTWRRNRRPPGRAQASPGRQAAPQSPGAGGVPLSTMLRSSSKVYGSSSSSSNFPISPSGYAQWRQRVKLPDGQRVFCISGTGNHSHGIRAGLVSRGWYENPEHNSPFFDYKWSSNPLDIAHEQLWPGQTVNHFKNAQCLTTKHGLCHTVREMVWWEAADAATFYPRAYDISDEANRREFLQDVRWTAAESLIKRALLDGAVTSEHVPYTGPPKKSGQSISSCKHTTAGPASAGSGGHGGGSSAAVPGGSPSVAAGQSGAMAEGAPGTGGDEEGTSGQSGRLQQRTGTEPLVDLPSLRLACRVIAARLRQQRHLRVVHAAGTTAGGGGAGGGGASDGAAPAEVDLSPAQWQQLVRHRALFCSAPLIPPPDFDPNWISGRRFITSIHLPRPGASGSGSRKPRRDGKSPRRKHGKSRGRSPRAEGEGAASRAQGDGKAGEEGERGPEMAAAAAGGASDAPSRGGGADGGSESSNSSTEPEEGPGARKGEANETASGRDRGAGKVAVADAAELLRKAAAAGRTRRRRHSAPAAGGVGSDGGGGGGAGSDGGAAIRLEVGAGAGGEGKGKGEGEGGSRSGSEQGDVDGGADDDVPDPSWLPSDLPAICYDDAALQALDHATWREAAEAILSALSATVVQTHISGTNNIWIVKPAGKSRGRGIRLFNDPDALLQYTRGEEAQGLEARWVAQKYVERPLIIWRRKFDIRQWVLVTDWNPLCVWFYSTCYLRFAATDYDPNNLDIFQHLTNNSVAKYYEGPVKEDEITANGNMWSIPRFEAWLEETYGRADLWPALLQPAMKHVVICTLKCAQDLIAARKGSCQLYGYDFLIDDQLRVWLLEINSSPTLESSTPITTQLCADVQEDILRVTVDLPDHIAATSAAAKRRAAAPAGAAVQEAGGGVGDVTATADAPGGAGGFDTGKWECIVDGGEEMKRPDYTGLNLELKGTAIPVPSPARAPSSSSFVGRLYAATRQGQSQQGLGDKPHASPSPGKGPDRNTLRQASPPRQPYQHHIPPPPQQPHQNHHNSGASHTHGGAEEESGAQSSAYAASAAAAVRVYAASATGSMPAPAGSRAGSRASPMRLRTPRLSSTNISTSAAAAQPTAGGVVGPVTAPQLSATWDSGAAAALVSEFQALGGGNLLASLPPPSVATPGTPQRLMTPRGDTTLAASALAAGAAAVLGTNGGLVPGAGPGGGGMEPLSPMAARASLFSRPGMRS